MKLKRALVLLLTLCMIFSVMSPAASALQGVVSGTDSKGNAGTGASQVGNVDSDAPQTLRDQLLAGQKNPALDSALASEALGRLKNETLEELAKAAETFGPDELVSVFVVMDEKPTSELYADINAVPSGVTNGRLNSQNLVLNNIKDRLPVNSTLELRYQFTYLINAFSITTEFDNLAAIAEIPGVASVFIMPEYQALTVEEGSLLPKTSSSSSMTGVPSVWADCGFTGTGMRIAILDTGLDLDHPAFAEVPELTTTSLSAEEIAEVMVNLNAYKMMQAQGLNLTAEQLYRSGKVPFAFNYSDWNLLADHQYDNQGDHGTHVAGIAAANRVEGYDYAGMAPDAQIIVMKVFGNQGSMMDGVIAALEDALVLDCDVVNMSLGSSAGFSSISSVIDEVFARVREQDMIMATAAGNEYTSGIMNSHGLNLSTTEHPDNATVDAPATYLNSTVVASVDNMFAPGPYFTFGETVVGYRDTNGIPLFSTLAELGELEYVFVPGLGYPDDYKNIDVEGKIALVTRGTITFMDKMHNAAEAGAVGVLIVNNEPGSVAGFAMDFSGVTEPVVPCVMISMETGAEMEAAENKTMVVSAVEGMVPDAAGGQMSVFSSWGVTPDLRLLPNLAGVGGNIMSTVDPSWTGEGGYYGLMSGTSMATPQVAGISALVLQYLRETFPEKTDAERRVLADALLMSTAVPVRNSTTGVESSPRQQGSGLVNAIGAVTSGAYLSVPYDSFGSTKPQIELGDDPDKTGVYTFRFSVNNLTNAEKTYTLDGSLLTEEVYEAYGKKFMDGTDRELSGTIVFDKETVTVPANGSVEIQVSVTLSEEDKAWMEANFENGIYVEGFVYLIAEEGGVDLSLPYMGFYGEWNQAPIFDTGFWYDNSFWYDDAEPTQTMTWNIVWTSLGEQDWILGINPYANVYDESMYDPANNVISPNGDGVLDGIVDIYLSQMRNARNVTYTFTNEDGIVLSQVSDPYCKKALYMLSYGQTIPTVYSWSGYPMYDFTDADGNVLPDGTKLTLTIQAETDYGNGGLDINKYNTIEIPLTIDVSAPKLEGVEQIVYGGRNYVELTVSDLSSLAYVILTNATGTRYLDSKTDCIDFIRNEDGTWNVLFDVTGLGPQMQVILCDYGANEGYYPVEFTAANNMPEVEEGTLFGYRIYDENLSALGYYDYQYGWHQIDKETAELTEWTNDYTEYYAITAAEYVDGLIFAVDAGNNLVWMEPGLFNRYHIVNLGKYIIDMTFDDVNEVMYVLAKEEIMTPYGSYDVTVLYTMDLLTGELSYVNEWDHGYGNPWCLADVNGELYVGLYNSYSFAKLDEYYQVVELIDYKEEPVMLPSDTYYAQSMTYSEVDNCIYWAHCGTSDRSMLLKIDMTYEEVSDYEMTHEYLPGDAEFVGIFVLEETDYTLPEATELSSIAVDESHLQLLVGESKEIVASPLPWTVDLGELTWTSADETIATVENGVVTAVSEGKTEITVSNGTLSTTVTVRVINITGNIYGYNYYSMTTEGAAYGTWIDLRLDDMDIFATVASPVDFIVADYNGHDGKIYGYNELGQFFSFDPVSGECIQIGSGIPSSTLPRDMAYDYENGIMYAATTSAEGFGSLSMVNLNNGELIHLQYVLDAMYYGEGFYQDETGSYSYMGNLSEQLYMTLAWSPEGLLAITNTGNLVHLVTCVYQDPFTGNIASGLGGVTIMEGLGYPFYYQSMAYDHANDKLVWGSVESYSIVWIDPWDPAVVSLGLPLGLEMFEFVGMYTIPEVIPEKPQYAVEDVLAQDMVVVTGAVKAPAVEVYPTNVTDPVFIYTSDNTDVVTVDEYGNITAVAPGTATITLTVTGVNESSATTTFTVTVKPGTGTIFGHLGGDLLDNSTQYWLWFEDSDPSNMQGIWADLYYYSAEYCAETGYVYGYGYNPEDWSSSWYFVTLDPANNWNVVSHVELEGNFPFVYDMTYNYAEGIMYAVADVSDSSSDLYRVNLETGELLPAMQLTNPNTGADMMFTSIAAGPDGTLYAIPHSESETYFDWVTWQDVTVTMPADLYVLDPNAGTMEVLCSTGFNHNLLGSMTYDLETDRLYWNANERGANVYESHMVAIDPATFETFSLGTPSMGGAMIFGMYTISDAELYPESNAELSIMGGKKAQFAYVGETVKPAILTTGAEGAAVVWTSGDETIATVDSNGVITAVAPGATSITASVTVGSETVSVTFAMTVIATDSYFLAFNNQTNTWEKVDRQNPENISVIEGSTTEAALKVVENVGGVLYAYDVEGNFYTIDATTLVATKMGVLDMTGMNEIIDLAYDALNGRLLALIDDEYGYSSIYEVNLVTGAVTGLVPVNCGDRFDYDRGDMMRAIAVGLDGTVYIFDSYPDWGTQDSINIVDMATGELKFLNTLNRISVYTDNDAPLAMITDPLTGMIYVLSSSNGQYYGLHSFDPATNLVATHGYVGEVVEVEDEWGWTELQGNTYSTLVTLDTHTHVFLGEAENITIEGCSAYLAKKQYCVVCGEVTTLVSDHDFQFVETVNPTCVDAGYDLYACACGESKMLNPVVPTGHTVEGEATCTEGVACSVCGVEAIPALGHDMVVNDSTITCPGTYDATCSVCGEAGKATISGRHTIYVCVGGGNGVYIYTKDECDLCGTALRAYTKVNKIALGHNDPNPEATALDCTAGFDCDRCNQHVSGHERHCYDRVIVAAGCESIGTRTYDCVRCEVNKVYYEDPKGHVPGDEATCTEPQVCLECDKVLNPAQGHKPNGPATCTAPAFCTVCGQVLVPATGHNPVAVPGYAPSCTEPGMSDGTVCDTCGEILVAQFVTSALGHDLEIKEGKAPTCTETGLTDGKICKRCNTVVAEQEVIPALGHTEVIDAAVAATCTETGLTEGKHCEVCGEVLVAQEVLPVLEHTYESVVTEPTCAASGYTTHTCSVCGDSYKDSATAKREHNWDDGVLIVEPTCEGLGTKLISCQYDDCDASFEFKTVPALGHKYDSVVTAPTCTEEGFTTHTCSVCGDSYVDGQTATVAHSFGEWTVTKEATTEAEGEETRTCACGETETRAIPMLEKSNTVLIVVIAVVAVGAIAAVVFFVLKKRA